MNKLIDKLDAMSGHISGLAEQGTKEGALRAAVLDFGEEVWEAWPHILATLKAADELAEAVDAVDFNAGRYEEYDDLVAVRKEDFERLEPALSKYKEASTIKENENENRN